MGPNLPNPLKTVTDTLSGAIHPALRAAANVATLGEYQHPGSVSQYGGNFLHSVDPRTSGGATNLAALLSGRGTGASSSDALYGPHVWQDHSQAAFDRAAKQLSSYLSSTNPKSVPGLRTKSGQAVGFPTEGQLNYLTSIPWSTTQPNSVGFRFNAADPSVQSLMLALGRRSPTGQGIVSPAMKGTGSGGLIHELMRLLGRRTMETVPAKNWLEQSHYGGGFDFNKQGEWKGSPFAGIDDPAFNYMMQELLKQRQSGAN